MRKNLNSVHIEGRIYQHDLEVKEVKNQESANFGKPYIAGKIEVVVDEEGMNILPVEFTYVSENTKAGGKNKTYAELLKIIQTGKTWIANGKDEATMVSLDTNLAINDFIASDDTPVAQVIMNGGFINIVGKLNPNMDERHLFKMDMVITSAVRIEATEENHNKEDYVSVRGAVFNFRNDLLPVEFKSKTPEGMAYFENLEPTSANPVYTQVWGVVNYAEEKAENTMESAFGGAMVDSRTRRVKEWCITTAKKVPYDFGEEGVMTMDELNQAAANRQVLLATKKKEREEYLANKNATAASNMGGFAAAPSPAAGPAKSGGFSF